MHKFFKKVTTRREYDYFKRNNIENFYFDIILQNEDRENAIYFVGDLMNIGAEDLPNDHIDISPFTEKINIAVYKISKKYFQFIVLED